MSVTFVLSCYNQGKFVREAVRGALAQDYHPLEILISDNHSTDDTLDIIREEIGAYSAPHTVRVLTNTENTGLEDLARATGEARGEFLVGAHGDDISLPIRTQRLLQAWKATGATLLSSNAEIIDAQSRVLRPLNSDREPRRLTPADLARKGFSPYAHGACLAWHRELFEGFTRLDWTKLRSGHDHVMPFRATLLNGHYYVPEILLHWRVHGGNFGLESTDRTQGPLVMTETAQAYNLSARLCMLDELDEFVARRGATPDLVELRIFLVEAIIGLVRTWSGARNELYRQDLRPTWIDRTSFEAQPGYGAGYGMKKQVAGKRLRKLARRAKASLKRLRDRLT